MARAERTVSRLAAAAILAMAAAWSQPTGAEGLKKPDPALQRRVDDALENQDAMIAKVTDKLKPQRPGVRDIYFVGVAGWGDQDVFRTELRAVRSLFDNSFGTQGRSVSLVNHAGTLDIVPMATHDTIHKTVMSVAGKMDAEEDVLLMYMTSHGGRWNGFDLVLNGNNYGPLLASNLARTLGASRIRNRIVIVSACYSGQFVPALADEHTLLITAAASDRASFGCSNEADWTWFGRAMFADAMPKIRRFAAAFDAAIEKIAAREKRRNELPSVPQIRLGSGIRPVLEEMGL